MKKIITLLVFILCLTIFACGEKESLTVEKTSFDVQIGETFEIKSVVTGIEDPTFIYTINNDAVENISGNKFEAKKIGNSVITVSIKDNDELKVEVKVTIKDVEYTVTFANTSIEEQKVSKGQNLNKPADPTKSNSIFTGWFLDSDFTEKVVFPLVINKDTKLYASFSSYKDAFKVARENTIGDDVKGYEYDYTIDAKVAYSALSLTGNTKGNSKYSESSEIKFYDEHVNSGLLFVDGTSYQLRKLDELVKYTINKKGELKDFTTEKVEDDKLFDSSSFAKAIFEYKDEDLKSIEKTSIKNEYELKTKMNVSSVMSLVGKYINHPIIEKILFELPETDVKTGMYVTFDNGNISSYRYKISVKVTKISFDLEYKLNFKNVGVDNKINPKIIEGLYQTTEQITSEMEKINKFINDFKTSEKSGYEFNLETAVGFEGKNDINAKIDGTALRKVTNDTVYFHNDININTDYKNADLYKEKGIDDIHIKKTMLSNKEVHIIEKKLLADKTYLQENYNYTDADGYYLLDILKQISAIKFIQKEEDGNKIKYSLGVNVSEVEKLLKYVNKVNIDPLNNSSTVVKLFGDFKDIQSEDISFTIEIENNKLQTIKVEAKGLFNTSLQGSRDFTSEEIAEYKLLFEINVVDANKYEPYEKVKDAK